jgi:hypothetical protein
MSARVARRLALFVATGMVVMAPTLALAGGGGPVMITTTVEGSFVRQFTNGFAAATCGDVGKELVPDPLPVPWVWSTAFEFPLPDMAGSTVTSATLTLTDADGDSPDPMRIYGYAGDGVISSLDHDQAPGTPVAFTPTGTGAEVHDVTSLVGASQIAAGWAGFLIVPDTSDFDDTVHHSFDCSSGEGFPVLTVTWGPPLPDASMLQSRPNPLTALGAIVMAVSALVLVGRVPAARGR